MEERQLSGNNNMVLLPDVWCAPGIGFATDATSVDCVVARRNPNASGTGRGRADADRNSLFSFSSFSHSVTLSKQRSCIARHNIHNLEQIYDQDKPSTIHVHCPGSGVVRSGLHPHFRGLHRPPGGLAEELLELGDRIGYVSTGLRDAEILRCLRKMKHSILSNAPSHITTGIDRKCSICRFGSKNIYSLIDIWHLWKFECLLLLLEMLEEYEANDDVGELECGHIYHLNCIKQWLLQKNACPICRVVAAQ